jgi:hypothetical protein
MFAPPLLASPQMDLSFVNSNSQSFFMSNPNFCLPPLNQQNPLVPCNMTASDGLLAKRRKSPSETTDPQGSSTSTTPKGNMGCSTGSSQQSATSSNNNQRMFPTNNGQPSFPSPTIGEFNPTTTAPLTPESGFYEEQHNMIMTNHMHHAGGMMNTNGGSSTLGQQHQGTSPVSISNINNDPFLSRTIFAPCLAALRRRDTIRLPIPLRWIRLLLFTPHLQRLLPFLSVIHRTYMPFTRLNFTSIPKTVAFLNHKLPHLLNFN